MKKITTVSLVIAIIMGLLYPFTLIVYSQQDLLSLEYIKFRSRVDTDVYPGSSSAKLVIGIRNSANYTLESIYGCIESLPPGFELYRDCSPAYTLNGSITNSVDPGEVIEFSFQVDVDENVAPGVYSAVLNITYRDTVTGSLWSEAENISFEVKPYPPISISVVRSYLEPVAYPGSNNVDLVIEIENTGDSTIAYADVYVEPPSIINLVNNRTSISNLGPDSRTLITYSDVSVAVDATPGTYSGKLYIDALMTTPDEVRYRDSVEVGFSITIEEAPSIRLDIVDHGTTSNYPVNKVRYTRLYTTLINYDQAVIQQVIARITLLNTVFENGEKTTVVTIDGPIGYGDTFTIYSPPVTIIEDVVYYTIELSALCSIDGTEYWATYSYTLHVTPVEPEYEVYVIDNYWVNSVVYPGSANEEFAVLIYNAMNSNLEDVYATLSLPEVFYPREIVSGPYTLGAGDIARIIFSGININNTAKPGNYTVELTLSGVIVNRDGSFANFSLNYTIVIPVSKPQFKVLKLIDYGWISGYAYSNMVNTGIRVLAELVANTPIVTGYAELIVPRSLTYRGSGKPIVEISGAGYGDIIETAFTRIDIGNYTGTVPIAIRYCLLLSLNGAEFWVNETYSFLLEVLEPRLNLTLVDALWITRYTANSMDNIGVRVVLQSLSRDAITELYARLIPPPGVKTPSGLDYVVWSSDYSIGYGEVFTAEFDGFNINTSDDTLSFNLVVEAVLTIGNSYYRASWSTEFVLELNKPPQPLHPVTVQPLYRGQPVIALPNTTGLTLRIVLANDLAEDVSLISGKLVTPSGIIARNPIVTCTGIVGGGSCVLDYVVDIYDIEPGVYNIQLLLEYYFVVRGAVIRGEYNYTLPVIIGNPSDYDTELVIVDYYWGEETPYPVYPGAYRAGLTVTIYNTGLYTAYDVVVRASTNTDKADLLSHVSSCNAPIEPGGLCSLIFYLDLRNAEPGVIGVNLTLQYYTRVYGSAVTYTRDYEVRLVLPSPPTLLGNSSLALVDSGWSNDWPAYPGSSNAVYTVSVANLLPYRISSISARLYTADLNITGDLETYVEGPVNSLSTFTLSFKLDIPDNIEPGSYPVLARISYYVEAGVTGYRDILEIPLLLNISDPSKAVEVLQYGWVVSQPIPGEHGARYYIVIQNKEFPRMYNPVMHLALPSGILYSPLNTTTAVLTPSSIVQATQLQTTMTTQEITRYLAEALRTIGTPPSMTSSSVSKGDYVIYTLPLNLVNISQNNLTLRGYIEFLDHWDSFYKVNVAIPLIVYGRPPILEISAPTRISYVNGTAKLEIRVLNNFSSPIYNLYIVLVPQSPQLVPRNAVKYIDKLEPGKDVVIEYLLVYSPLPTDMGYTTSYPLASMGSIFTVSVIYRDVSGAVNTYNTTLSVIIEPLVNLVLSPETSAVYRDGRLVVSGIIINSGTSYAKSTWITVFYGNKSGYSFIGDIDPASQTAFRVEIPVSYSGDKALVLITYMDESNTTYTRSYTLNVELVEEVKTTTAPVEVEKPPYYAVVGAVAVFLALVFITIYWYLRRHRKHVEA
ncbi:MAG: hypothetical protein ABWW65_02435 [Thermoprotei archaeon]